MAALSKVDVANKALVEHLACEAIVSFEDDTTEARKVSVLWETVRDEVIREYTWRCLKARKELAYSSGSTPAFGYLYAYPLPADFNRLIEVMSNSVPLKTDWELENGFILYDGTGPLQIRYIKNSDNPAEWDALMVSTVAAKLARALAPSLNADKISAVNAIYKEVHAEAKRVSAQEGNVRKRVEDPWISARR